MLVGLTSAINDSQNILREFYNAEQPMILKTQRNKQKTKYFIFSNELRVEKNANSIVVKA